MQAEYMQCETQLASYIFNTHTKKYPTRRIEGLFLHSYTRKRRLLSEKAV